MPPGSDDLVRAAAGGGTDWGSVIVIAAAALVGLIAAWDFHRRMAEHAARDAVRAKEVAELQSDMAGALEASEKWRGKMWFRVDDIGKTLTEIRERLARLEGPRAGRD